MWGAIIAGVGGIVGGLMGNSSARRQRRAYEQAAQATWETAQVNVELLNERAAMVNAATQREFSRADAAINAQASASGVSVGSASVTKALEMSSMERTRELAALEFSRASSERKIISDARAQMAAQRAGASAASSSGAASLITGIASGAASFANAFGG